VPEENCACMLLIIYFGGDYVNNPVISGTCCACVDSRNIYRRLVWKPELRIVLGGPSNRWEDNN
jgi:hypothetical protein